MNRSLRILQGNAAERSIPLTEGKYEIGRGEDVAIQIDSRSVSRKHAEVIVERSMVRLLDCGSQNGTILNGKQVTMAELHPGDRIEIGEVQLEYISDIPESIDTHARLSANSHPASPPRSMRKFFFIVFAVSLGIATLGTALSFQNLFRERLRLESMDRASGLVRYLAEKNRENLRLGNDFLLDSESVRKEKGVREVQIINRKGRILSPVSRLNQMANDPFTTEALAQKSDHPILPSPRLPDGSYILVHPIRSYNDNLGTYETLGVAKVVFSPDEAIGEMNDSHRLMFLLICASLLAAILLAWAATRSFSQPILRLGERLGRWRSNLPTRAEKAPFKEWQAAYDEVDRLTEEDQ